MRAVKGHRVVLVVFQLAVQTGVEQRRKFHVGDLVVQLRRVVLIARAHPLRTADLRCQRRGFLRQLAGIAVIVCFGQVLHIEWQRIIVGVVKRCLAIGPRDLVARGVFGRLVELSVSDAAQVGKRKNEREDQHRYQRDTPV